MPSSLPSKALGITQQSALETSLREAKLEDAHSIAEVQVACFRATYADIVGPEKMKLVTVKGRKRSWLKRLAKENRRTFVAVDQRAKLVGFTSMVVDWETPMGIAKGLYVLPSYQHRGIGRALHAQRAKFLKQADIPLMVIKCLKKNVEGCRFWEGIGCEFMDETSPKAKIFAGLVLYLYQQKT